MYLSAAAHFGIILYGLFKGDRQSRALQASAISCLTDAITDSFIQCPWPDLNRTTSASALEDLVAVLACVNVSYIVRQRPRKADDPARLC